MKAMTSFGFIPAVNRINWTGDAGIVASLEDMIAWERFIDATRDDAEGLYRRLSVSPSFADGTPAQYGFGLAHMESEGVAPHRAWRRLAGMAQPAAACRERAALGRGSVQSSSKCARGGFRCAARSTWADGAAPVRRSPITMTGPGAIMIPKPISFSIFRRPVRKQLSARFTTDAELLDLVERKRCGRTCHDAPAPGQCHPHGPPRRQSPRHTDPRGRRDHARCGRHVPQQRTHRRLPHRGQGSAFFGSFQGFLGQGAMQPSILSGAISGACPASGRWMRRRPATGPCISRAIRHRGAVGCWLARRVRFEKAPRSDEFGLPEASCASTSSGAS